MGKILTKIKIREDKEGISMKYDVIILGGGSAGMSAAIYCKRANLNVCIIDNNISGGRPLGYLEIENYLGLGKTDTFSMIEKFKEHVSLFDIPVFEFQTIKSVDYVGFPKRVVTEEDTFESESLIIATGSKPRKLGVPGEEEFVGRGVHYCAICDGPMYKDKNVIVVGGGNSACEEALGLSKICKHVHLMEYTDRLNADQVTVDEIYNTKNIGVSLSTQITEIIGTDKVNSVKILPVGRSDCSPIIIETDGVFPYIGMTANSELFDYPICKEGGFIKTDNNMSTSVDGVYAVGDVRAKNYRQVITAVADGAIAGIAVRKYLK